MQCNGDEYVRWASCIFVTSMGYMCTICVDFLYTCGVNLFPLYLCCLCGVFLLLCGVFVVHISCMWCMYVVCEFYVGCFWL